jgi:Rho GTPase-activating protein RGD1
VLLNRLKQDVATCKEVSAILKKRATIEEEHGKSLQPRFNSETNLFSSTKTSKINPRYTPPRRCKTTVPSPRKCSPNLVLGRGFNRQVYMALNAWDMSSTTSLTFAAQVSLMVEEISELGKSIDRKRKTLKHEALRDETSVNVAETAAEKARSKHESLGAELERAMSALRGESYPTTKGRFGTRRSGAQVRFNVLSLFSLSRLFFSVCLRFGGLYGG